MTGKRSKNVPSVFLHTTPHAYALLYTGIAFVIVGGLVAAVTDPLSLERGGWAAAYLVLVAGVAQASMGVARMLWPTGPGMQRGAPNGWPQFVFWNLGNAGVIFGTLLGVSLVVFMSSVLLVAALALALMATANSKTPSTRRLLITYHVFLFILAVSIPVGMVLTALRNA